ncbi:MAG TPA: sterol desaturase family protein [Thermoanaerobaculia bacterium]
MSGVAHVRLAPRTLRDALRFFIVQPSPRILVAFTALALIVRLLLGEWRAVDGWIVLAVILWWPVQERLVHEFLLHMEKPLTIGPLSIHPIQAAKHLEHHRDPWRADVLFIYPGVYKYALPATVLLWLAATRDLRLALTGATTYLCTVMQYEWTHFLIHTPYVPRSAWYRRRWRNHRLHHFKNDEYWFGVTTLIGDAVFRSAPEAAAVPYLAHCRGIAAEDAVADA